MSENGISHPTDVPVDVVTPPLLLLKQAKKLRPEWQSMHRLRVPGPAA